MIRMFGEDLSRNLFLIIKCYNNIIIIKFKVSMTETIEKYLAILSTEPKRFNKKNITKNISVH